jgi:GTP-binding protein SAR1
VRVFPPTKYASYEEVEIGNTVLKAFDLGGHEAIRHIWEEYLPEVSGIVFVIDAADESRMDEAKEELDYLLSLEEAKGCPILILGNKQDLECALGKDDLCGRLGVLGWKTYDAAAMERAVEVFPLSLTHDQNHNTLQQAFTWLCDHL